MREMSHKMIPATIAMKPNLKTGNLSIKLLTMMMKTKITMTASLRPGSMRMMMMVIIGCLALIPITMVIKVELEGLLKMIEKDIQWLMNCFETLDRNLH